MKKVTRREFIVDSTIMTAGTIGAITLGSGLLAPEKAQAAKEKFIETSCGTVKNKGNITLVAYASDCGSTGEVAEAIGQVLCDSGMNVDVRLLESLKDVSSYHAAVIGSAVHGGKWLPEAFTFLERNQKVLCQMPVAYFLTCLALYKSNDQTRSKARSYLDPILDMFPRVKPVDMGFFAGVLDYSKLSFMTGMIMKSKMKKKGVPEGDHRNWDDIRFWAKGLSSKLPDLRKG